MLLSSDRVGLWLTVITVGATLGGLAAHWSGAGQLATLFWIAAYLAGGIPSGLSAARALVVDRVLDIDLLMVVAAMAAAAVGAPMEGAVLLALFSLSGTLEHRAMGRARRAVEALMHLRPESALLRRGAEVVEVASASLVAGDVVVLRPGARVPVDGRVVTGSGSMDESTITGESLPVTRAPGDQVFEATVNLTGVLEVQVTRPLSDSTVARMIRLVTEAQAARAPSERFSDWFGQRYTVAVLVGAVLALGIFLASGHPFDTALYKAATLLVAASPCAVVISVPAAILSALSASARGGVLFKGGAALETLAAVRGFAFDKTGTLTTGQAQVRRIAATGDEGAMLALLAGIEAQSEHPIAAAIRAEAIARGLVPVAVENVTAHPSEGLTADGGLWAGNRRLMARMGANPEAEGLAGFDEASETVVWLGQGARVLGAVSVADRPRASSAAGLAALRQSGVRTLAMMTGDRRPVAERIGAELGLRPEEIHADLLPDDKVALIAVMAGQGKVAFVGDGVNDAAALARADVGIAMGAAGSEVALQAAGVALMSDDMTRLAEAHRLARRTARIIRQNLIFAIGAMLVLVTGALVWDLPLPLAVIGHEGGTVLVVLNGLRLLADPIRRPSTGAGKAAAMT
ncbi:heavy metal-(Cd/Co/Hg/Pb/Zn)-translocating P-type ATPase [Gemmobacter megaterium]|uniref:Heavy metal-(Cd/Co/Hg/Pb/Zn)-translocating P-type ATPase n=1 Tax=Gemmobacter megaterium TaxID=1086013 RepID=A0A1N7M7X3_9RHOB|nr:cation-translocating P-type ATPase [Gemmobacter megaterium]GGE08351.1 heavy metal-(Cd/Co/Hg/Pb/Zn)-translocating P-type ATPase [Gemmobacter megaterium]SIS82152.1 heavy metal-(Cd/Co/Hg/Pb/Zn)-translocating P-type ATPase [Gemmobacter megaterium]